MKTRNPKRVFCKAKSKHNGKHCKYYAIPGGTVCRFHGGAAPQVKNKAKERMRQYVADMVDPDRVLQEAARLAFSDIREAFDEKGHLLPVKKWPDELASAISATESVRRNLDHADGQTDLIVKLKVWDKPKNIELLCKHLGLLQERLDLKGDIEIKWQD